MPRLLMLAHMMEVCFGLFSLRVFVYAVKQPSKALTTKGYY